MPIPYGQKADPNVDLYGELKLDVLADVRQRMMALQTRCNDLSYQLLMQNGPPTDLIFSQRTEIELLRRALGFQGSSYIVETELRELRRENRTLRSELEGLSSKLHESSPSQIAQDAALKETLRAVKLERTRLWTDRQKLMEDHQALQVQFGATERLLEETNARQNILTKERDQLTHSVEQATARITALETQLSYTQQQLEQRSEDAASAKAAFALLQTQSAEANRNMSQMLAADRDRVEGLLLECAHLQADLRSAAEAAAVQREELRSSQIALNQVELTLRQRTQEAEELMEQQNETKAAHQRTETQLAATSDELQLALANLDEVKRTLGDRNVSLEALKANTSGSEERLRTALAETEGRAQQQTVMIGELRKTLQSREETLQSNQQSFETQLQTLRQESETQLQTLRQESSALNTRLAELPQLILSELVASLGVPDVRTWDALTKALSNQQTEFLRLQTQRMELVDQLTVSERKLQEAEKGLQELQNLVRQMENVAESSSSKHEADASLAERLNNELQNVRATHSSQVKDLLQQVAVAEARLATCDSHQLEILNLKAENDYLLKQIQEAKESNVVLSTLCESLKGELQTSKSPQRAIPVLLPPVTPVAAEPPADQPNLPEPPAAVSDQPNLLEPPAAVSDQQPAQSPTRRTPRRRTRNEPPATPSQPSQPSIGPRRTPRSKASQTQPPPTVEPAPGKRRTASSARDTPPKRIRSEKTGILNNAAETPLIAHRAPVVMASGLKESQRLEMIDIVTRLGGTARTTPVFDREITHVVALS